MNLEHLTKKQLAKYIEDIEEFILDADNLYIDLRNAQDEYKKRYGKEYEY